MQLLYRLLILVPSVLAKFKLEPVVDSKVGTIKGVRSIDGAFSMFLGIPYAEVDEDNPFGIAKPYPNFENDFYAYNDSIVCPQELKDDSNVIVRADCLNLNIYVPNKASYDQKLAVLLWVHGGGFEEGYASLYGPNYLLQQEIILVSINYRLGVYGFMCLDIPEVPGNQGFKDQLLAMKWVRENIADFGGDADKITVYGQSAGSAAVEIHLVTQKQRLFSQAILSSGSMFRRGAIKDSDPSVPLRMAKQLSYNTNDVYDALSFLKDIHVAEVVSAASELSIEYHGCIEKPFNGVDSLITELIYEDTISEIKSMPILIGSTNDEYIVNKSGRCFDTLDPFQEFIDDFEYKSDSLYNLLRDFYVEDWENDSLVVNDFFSDVYFNYPSIISVRRLLDSEALVYYYLFSYTGDRKKVADHIANGGAHHGEELKYIFDKNETLHAEDHLMMERLTKMWADFVKYGNPTPNKTELSIPWPPATDSLQYLNIDTELSVRSRPFLDRMAFLDLWYECKKYAAGCLQNTSL